MFCDEPISFRSSCDARSITCTRCYPIAWISLQTYCAAQEDKAAKAILQDDPFADADPIPRRAQVLQGMALPAMR